MSIHGGIISGMNDDLIAEMCSGAMINCGMLFFWCNLEPIYIHE